MSLFPCSNSYMLTKFWRNKKNNQICELWTNGNVIFLFLLQMIGTKKQTVDSTINSDWP